MTTDSIWPLMKLSMAWQEEPMEIGVFHKSSKTSSTPANDKSAAPSNAEMAKDLAEVKRQMAGLTTQFTKLMATFQSQAKDPKIENRSALAHPRPTNPPYKRSHDLGVTIAKSGDMWLLTAANVSGTRPGTNRTCWETSKRRSQRGHICRLINLWNSCHGPRQYWRITLSATPLNL